MQHLPLNEQKPPSTQRGRNLVFKSRGITAMPARFEMIINPEELRVELPARTTTQQTILGAYQDTWGHGVGTITLSGTSGWRELRAGAGDGLAWINYYYAAHHMYLNAMANDVPEEAKLWIILPPYTIAPEAASSIDSPILKPAGVSGGGADNPNYIFGAFYQVSSDKFETDRNRQSPLLWRFQWSFTILKDEMNPAPVPSKRLELDPAEGDLGTGITGGISTSPTTPPPRSAPSPTTTPTPPTTTPTPSPDTTAPPGGIGGPDVYPGPSLPPYGLGGPLAQAGTRLPSSVDPPTTFGTMPPLDPGLTTTLAGDTLRGIYQRLHLPVSQLYRAATINGLALDTPLPRGLLVSLPRPLTGVRG